MNYLKKLKTLIYVILIGSMGITFYSCSKEDIVTPNKVIKNEAGIDVIDGRLKFENHEQFMSFVKQYDGMDEQEKEMFESKLGIYSLEGLYQELIYQAQYTSDTNNLCFLDELCMQLPASIKSFINSNGEIQIGDSVTCYVKDRVYLAHKSKVARFSSFGETLRMNENEKMNFSSRPLAIRTINIPLENSLLKSNWHDSRYQKEFNPRSGWTYQFVYTLQTWDDPYGHTIWFLYNKLEYWHNQKHKWYPAGEPAYRINDVTVTVRAGIYGYYTDYYYKAENKSGDLITTDYGVPGLVGSYIYYIKLSGRMYISTDLNGTCIPAESYNINKSVLWEKSF